MKLKESVTYLFDQLNSVINGISDEQYVEPIKVLSGSTIGQHTRHILEFFIELDLGYNHGIVNYDKRLRSLPLESSTIYAMQTIVEIEACLAKPDKELSLHIGYGYVEDDPFPMTVRSNYYRELVYNIEHTVHHMAFIRIGIQTVSDFAIPYDFGVAPSTVKYRKECAR